jgi:hypothetical protein
MNLKRMWRNLKSPHGLVLVAMLALVAIGIGAVVAAAPWETLALAGGGLLLPAVGIVENVRAKDNYVAAEDLSDYQYHIVVLDATTGKIRLPDVATDVPYGVLQNAPGSGEAAVVAPLGCGSISKVVANNALAIGTIVALEFVGAADAGKAQTAASGQFRVGVVVEASSAEDDLCGVLLVPMSLPALLVTDLALASSLIVVGDAGGVAAAVAMSGDVTITNAGVTAIGADKVAHAMLKNDAVETHNVKDANITAAKEAFWKTGNTTSIADSLAIPVTHGVVVKTTGADAEALTLANGVAGQVLTIVLGTDGGGDGTLTPTTKTGFATIVFADAGDTATLLYVDDVTGWVIMGTAGVAAPPVITV